MTTALAALLALVIHQLAYLLVFPLTAVQVNGLVDHSHMSTQWALVTPFAVLTTAAMIIRQVRLLGLAPNIGAKRLAVGGGALFLIQETIEAGIQTGEILSVLSNPAASIGLLLAPFLAFALDRVLRQASELVARFLQVPSPPSTPPVRRIPRPHNQIHVDAGCLGATSPRGPPRMIHV